jgi:hypothetical protein
MILLPLKCFRILASLTFYLFTLQPNVDCFIVYNLFKLFKLFDNYYLSVINDYIIRLLIIVYLKDLT